MGESSEVENLGTIVRDICWLVDAGFRSGQLTGQVSRQACLVPALPQ